MCGYSIVDRKNEPDPEKKIPYEIEGDRYNWWYVCGECHTAIQSKDQRCPTCGNYISWDN